MHKFKNFSDDELEAMREAFMKENMGNFVRQIDDEIACRDRDKEGYERFKESLKDAEH